MNKMVEKLDGLEIFFDFRQFLSPFSDWQQLSNCLPTRTHGSFLIELSHVYPKSPPTKAADECRRRGPDQLARSPVSYLLSFFIFLTPGFLAHVGSFKYKLPFSFLKFMTIDLHILHFPCLELVASRQQFVGK